jgi:hypothetical protein
VFVPDSDGMFSDGIYGIDPRTMPMFDLHVSYSAPTCSDDLGILDHQVKAIPTASVALIDSNEAWVTLFSEKRYSRSGHRSVASKPVLWVYHALASDPIRSSNLPRRCLNPSPLPPSRPGHHYCCRRCA